MSPYRKPGELGEIQIPFTYLDVLRCGWRWIVGAWSWWWNTELTACWTIVAVLAVPLIFLGRWGCQKIDAAEDAAEPCVEHVKGQVQTTDDLGRPATIERTWCVKYKPGRAQDGGGVP